jgi:hypothetical protein
MTDDHTPGAELHRTPDDESAAMQAMREHLAWADASILHLVEALELLDRSVHQFEATHPADTSDQVHQLLQQIRQSRPDPPTVRRPPAPER